MTKHLIIIATLFAGAILPVDAALFSRGARDAKESRSRAIDLLAEGQALEKKGDKQGAFQKYSESVQAGPSPAAYYNLGRLSVELGDRVRGQQYFEQALQLNPSYELAKAELMQLRGGRSDSAQVVKTMSSEVEGSVAPGSSAALADGPVNVDDLRREVVTMQSLAPPDPNAPREIVQPPSLGDLSSPDVTETASAGGLLGGALPSLSGSAEADSDSGTKMLPSRDEINNIAFSEESAKLPGSKGYAQGSKVALGTFAFHREKGDDYRAASRWREAAVEYETASKLAPGDVETRTLLAEMYARLAKPEEAAEQFAKAKAQNPQDPTIYYKEGNAHFDNQQYDLALGSYQKAIDLDPSHKMAINNMGVVYMEKKEYGRAVEKFKQVLKLDPAYDMAVLNLGIIYDEHLANKTEAVKYYQRYIELGGNRRTEVQRWSDAITGGDSSATPAAAAPAENAPADILPEVETIAPPTAAEPLLEDEATTGTEN